jgi:hypothetical protein
MVVEIHGVGRKCVGTQPRYGSHVNVGKNQRGGSQAAVWVGAVADVHVVSGPIGRGIWNYRASWCISRQLRYFRRGCVAIVHIR